MSSGEGSAGKGTVSSPEVGGGVHSPWGKELANLRAEQVWSLGPSRAPGAEGERWALGRGRGLLTTCPVQVR